MPFLLKDGTAVESVSTRHQAGNDATFISWTDLARRAGHPSWGHEAEFQAMPHYREQTRKDILRAHNSRRAAT